MSFNKNSFFNKRDLVFNLINADEKVKNLVILSVLCVLVVNKDLILLLIPILTTKSLRSLSSTKNFWVF